MAATTDTVTLRSGDGKEFTVSKSAALQSGLISDFLDMEEDLTGSVVPILHVDGATLEKIIVFLNKHAEEGLSAKNKMKFGDEFFAESRLLDLFNLAKAANYMNIKELLDETCQKIATIMENKSVEWVREKFGIENDFTPEEEASMRSEHEWAFDGVDLDEDE